MAHALLVDVHLKLKDYQTAMQALEKLEGLYMADALPADVHRQRGDALTGLRNKAGASLSYASARAKARGGSQLNSMCWAKATNRTAAKWLLLEALKDCDAALALLPECWECHDSRGLVMLRLKRFNEAVPSYDAAVSGIPASAMSLYGRGIAKTRTRRKAEGRADIAAAISISADVAEKFRAFGVRH